ncbi:MAG: hypothetical protein ACPGTS_01760, partial [Minisyncoccia bacterium]
RIEIQKAEKWEDLCEIIETYKTKIPEKRDYKLSGNNSEFQSWSKTMTVEEARELMTYLKMNVNFPE